MNTLSSTNISTKASNIASIVLAAGRGTRMKGFSHNKTLLPLLPERNQYEGSRPFIIEILSQLPKGPVAVVVHHDANAVKETIAQWKVTYIYQHELNGTGGAILAAQEFLQSCSTDYVIVTMGDVPLVRTQTYEALIRNLEETKHHGVLIAFTPEDTKQYGRLVVEGNKVRRIIEWQYCKNSDQVERQGITLCNAGIYAFRRPALLHCCKDLISRPHQVEKQINGHINQFLEYFLTDIVEIMNEHGYAISFITVSEWEVTGVDTPETLQKVQQLFAQSIASTLH